MSALFARLPRVAAAALLVALAVLLLPPQAGAQSAAAPEWSTYLGGGDRDRITAITQNADSDITLVGTTQSMDFATPPAGGTKPFSDSFLASFANDGTPITLPQVFGGDGLDEATGVALAQDHSVYIVGRTNSLSMRGAGNKVGELQGSTDAFLIRFNNLGEPEWYMYLGGIEADEATGVTVIGNSVYVCGLTNSNNFLNPINNPSPGSVNAFVVRVDINPTNPQTAPTIGWTRQPSIIGGPQDDRFFGIAPGPNGTLLAAGTTSSMTEELRSIYSFRLKNEYKGGTSDAFVVALEVDSGEPLWITYVGGNDKDEGKGIAAGANNTFVVAGNTASTDIAGSATPGGTNVFGAWVTHEGWTRLIQLRGGEGDEQVRAVTTDSNGTAYIGGTTGSPSLPRGSLGFDTQIEASGAQPLREGFVWMLPGWGGPGWDTFVGSTQVDEVTALTVKTSTRLIVGMETASSTGMPGTTSGRDSTFNGPTDGYLLAVQIKEPNLPQAGAIFDRPQEDTEPQDITTTTSRSSIFATWTEFTYILAPITTGYEWAIGTPENATAIRDFAPTDTPMRSTATGLNLRVGQKYLVTVRASNPVGLTQGAQSDGVVVTLPDGGLSEPDGGVGEPDGGPGGPDAGEGEPDGGAVHPDGGPSEPPDGGTGDGQGGDKDSPLGWGCAAAGGAGLPLLLGLIAFVLLGRRQAQAPR